MILTASTSLAVWFKHVLSTLNELTPEQALERLGANASLDLSGVFFHIAAPCASPRSRRRLPRPPSLTPSKMAWGAGRQPPEAGAAKPTPRPHFAGRAPGAPGVAFAQASQRTRVLLATQSV